MGLPSTSFILGVAFLVYLSSFVFFALLRVATGISIQRVGYSGLRRISYTPRDGIKIEIRGLGLHLHRPTFAQPTWVSVVVTELKVTLDLKVLGDKPRKRAPWMHWPNISSEKLLQHSDSASVVDDDSDSENQRSKTWERLTKTKEKIKRLHRKIRWIRLVDVVAVGSSVVLVDVGSVHVMNFTMAVDTRRRTVDRTRLFQHGKMKKDGQRPAEWIFTVRSILFTPEGSDSTELVDHCTLNVHGLLFKDMDGLREASISLKVGRANVPSDDIQVCIERARRCRRLHESHRPKSSEAEISFSDVIDELDRPGSREENIVRTVSDSKEFVASILRGIQEIQLAVSHLGVTKRVSANGPYGKPVYLNMSTKEIGLDLLRLDPRSPAHLMYFSRDDVAHQALLAAISISVGIDDGHNAPERLLYIPMATNTVRTTLPSKTIQYDREKGVADRNTNILFANFVITSPSTDLDPKHLSLLLDILPASSQGGPAKPPTNRNRRRLISRLLPKASIKLSIHEPVVRITLPPVETQKKGTDEFDLLIFAMSSISLDLESSHSASGDWHYSLASNFRVSSYHLYYQTATGHKFNLLLADSLEIKLQISATPEVAVVASGGVQTFSVYMVRPEINEGIRQIVAVLRSDEAPWSHRKSRVVRPNPLRRVPHWLVHVHLQASDFNIEIAGMDTDVSKNVRGMALHLESWSAEYKADKNENVGPRPRRRRFSSRSVQGDDFLLRPASPTSPRRHQFAPTDGRRLSIHTHGLEGFVVESADIWEQTPFLNLPKFELAVTTSSDQQGQIFHVQGHARSLFLHYSLYRHFAIGLAIVVLQNTFAKRPAPKSPTGYQTPPSPFTPRSPFRSIPSIEVDDVGMSPSSTTSRMEITTFDFKVNFVQIKGEMPAKPNLMLHLEGLEAGRHRWASPYGRLRLVRLYSETPRISGVWSRVVSIKSLRLDYRQSRRKYGTSYTEDKSFDIATDAIRIGVPHQLVVHKIFDNIVNVTKTSKQLLHRFKTGTNEDVLQKDPEGPRQVPKISLRGQALLFEIEDGSFEWKLGVIYRVGLLEQKQRLAREEAFRVKLKKIEESDRENRRENSRFRARSAHLGRDRREKHPSQLRSSSEPNSDRGSTPPRSRHGQRARYDSEGKSGLSGMARMSANEAWEKLQILNAQTWKKRIDHGIRHQGRAIRDLRSIFWGLDELPEEVEHNETIMAIPQRPGLLSAVFSDFNVVVDKPSFQLNEYPNFLHKVGKGMPVDMQYSLLLPMNVQITMGEARVSLRDYPLPLIHVPAIRPGQSPRLPSLSLKTDFVIAEEYRDHESSRHVNVVVVPREKNDGGEEVGGYSVDVPRTVGAVKTYSNISVDINTSAPTRITWGTSYQPSIQDAMQVIEGFTKPAVDPSERVGFWDKIRLTFHSRFNIAWKGDGDVHLILKGSRDPYMVTGHGAGFVMCWRGDVRWSICQHDDPRKFMTVNSGVYVLAVPDLSQSARQMGGFDRDAIEPSASTSALKHQNVVFKKTIMKLSGNVQWLAGLVFERNKDGESGRSFSFIPHYDVVFRNPLFAKTDGDLKYDAFRGFRSHHIHLSVAVAAPVDRDWSVSNLKPSSNYNSVHLTPRFFGHFFNWWSMFSGVMSLPIRQGPLWPGLEKSSKKFGRHLATIKYNLLLSPLYLSHVYKHKGGDDFNQETISATGLKLKLDSFMLDLHQRREEFKTKVQGPQHESHSRQNQTTGIRINEVQLDFISADIRALSATIATANPKEMDQASEDVGNSYQEIPSIDLSKFTIPDNDLGWIDMDDYVELDWMLPTESNPETKILPLAYAPRFTYFRQTDHANNVSGDPSRHSSFGREPTHYCVMSAGNDPRRVQCDLIQERLQKVNEQLSQNERAIGEHELHMIRNSDAKAQLSERLEVLRSHSEALRKKKRFLQATHKSLLKRLNNDDQRNGERNGAGSDDDEFFEAREDFDLSEGGIGGTDSASLPAYISEFNNRFIVHNMQLKWNNSLRNIILRYIHQVSQRRGFVYYMSRRAVKFLLDIVEEQKKAQSAAAAASDSHSKAASPTASPTEEEDPSVQDRISQLLGDEQKTVSANDPDAEGGAEKPSTKNADEDISMDYTAMKSYHVRLIAPQIQLQSEKNVKSAVLVTAKGMQLQVIQIMDKDRVTDTVSGLVQRRFSATMDSLQIFITNQQTFSTKYLHMYSGHGYGTTVGSAWPPWVPFEVMFEFNNNPYGFQRVVQRTSASMRFDKYNTLRLKYNDDVTKAMPGNLKNPDSMENRVDHIWVDFPHLRAICDSAQYFALYIIVLDLLLYNEPTEKTRSERLEKIMLASDFSDLTGAPEMVTMLQERIRQLEEIKTYFQVNEKYLDRKGWRDRINMEQDLATCEDELFFMMKAITTSQRNIDDKAQAGPDAAIRSYISASEIVWHLVREGGKSLAEFQLKNALYDRTDNKDGSNHNSMEIGEMHGLNLLPNALYPDMIAPYIEDDKTLNGGQRIKMLRVHWYMLEDIAGISVLDHFEINIFPLKIQLEREIGKKLFEYVFPGAGAGAEEGGSFSPFMVKQSPSALQESGENSERSDDEYFAEMQKQVQLEAKDTASAGMSLHLRLHPTLNLPDKREQKDQKDQHLKPKQSHHLSRHEFHRLSIFRESNRTSSGTNLARSGHSMKTENSSDTQLATPRPAASRRPSNIPSVRTSTDLERPKRFGIHRSGSGSSKATAKTVQRNDDLNQMLSRASNYMTLAYVKMSSMVLCLSYKGKSQRNFEDVHNLVFRMPTLEYRNKTWSNLDLALQLKKDVIRALISHTGAIIGNKFIRHQPTRAQQGRLRQIANSSSLLSTQNISNSAGSTPSINNQSPVDGSDHSASEPRKSFASGGAGSLVSRNDSYSSSLHSLGISGFQASGEQSAEMEEDEEEIGDDHEGERFADELSKVDQTEPDRSAIKNSLSRHLTELGHHVGARLRDTASLKNEDVEDHPRIRDKILGKLRHHRHDDDSRSH